MRVLAVQALLALHVRAPPAWTGMQAGQVQDAPATYRLPPSCSVDDGDVLFCCKRLELCVDGFDLMPRGVTTGCSCCCLVCDFSAGEDTAAACVT